jgi:hypothetical protein
MSLQQRPGLTIQENLISSTPDLLPTSPTVAFLASEKGMGNKNILVTDQVDFINKFGYPTLTNYKAWYNIYEYLRYTTNINVMRPINTSTWENYGIKFGRYKVLDEFDHYIYITLKTAYSTTDAYNDDIAYNTILNTSFSNANHYCAVLNREITENQDIAVSFCTSDTEYDSPISTEGGIYVFEDVVTTLPPELTSTMEINQLYIYNNSGTYTVQKLSYLYNEEIVAVELIDDGGTLKTKITIAYNRNLYDGGFLYTDIYLRNTGITAIDNQKFAVSESNDGSYIYLTLNENISDYLYEVVGSVYFYNPTLDFAIDSSTAIGYLRDEEKSIVVSPSGITYDDIQYKHILSSDYLTATKVVYDSKIQNGSTIKTFRQLINKDIDFTKNFVFLVFKKISGLFSLVEAFEVAGSRDSSVNAIYKRNYCEDVINQNSAYVYFKKNDSTTSLPIVTNNSSILTCVLTDDSGTDYTDFNDYTTFETATNFYRSLGSISFKYLMGIELNTGTYSTLNLTADIAGDREDCISINSIWNETEYLNNYTTMTTILTDELGIKGYSRYLNINNTNTIVYDNMKMIYSEFLEKYIWIPIIGDIAGIYVLEDLKNPYSACAGYRTTPIQNFMKMLYTNVSDDDLDLLCYNSLNHVIRNDADNNYYLFDILMYIDEDLISKRLNVRRTLNDFKFKLRNILKPYFFASNSYSLRNTIVSQINSLISEMITMEAVYSGNVVCDESNNTSDSINKNELNIQISLTPAPVIRQILIEINLFKQNLSLSETEL